MRKIKEIRSRFIKWCTNRLVKKLVLIFSFIIVLIVVLLTFVSYKIIENESINNVITNNANNLKLAVKNWESYYQGIHQYSFPHSNYERVLNAVYNESDDFSSSMYLEDYIRSLYYSRKDVEGIYLYIVEHE